MIGIWLALLMIGPEAAAPTGCSPPRPIGGEWVFDSDYPEEARRAGISGAVGIMLQIDNRGCPTGCEVTASSGYRILDEKTCMLMMTRARFRPTLDENWKPIATTWKRTVYWRL